MIKKTLAIISAFAMIFSFAACGKDEDLKKSNMVYDGKEVYSDKDGYYYNDEKGNRVEVDEDDVEYTDYNSDSGEKSTLSDADAEAILGMMSNPENFAEDITVPELDAGNEIIPEDSFTEIEVELDSEGNPDHGEESKTYQELLKSGTFTIEVVMCTTTAGETTTVPLTIIKDGNKIAAEVVAPMEGTSMRMRYLVKDGIQYAILPAMKFYFELGPAEDVDVMFSDEMLEELATAATESMTYVSSAEVVVDGKTYTCDIYETEDGSTAKIYYLDGILVREETITPEGDTNIVEYKTLSSSVDSSAFDLPRDYIDVTEIMGSEMFY